jgi:predicted nucleic acid-binding protein
MRVVLDTSVLISSAPPNGYEGAISVASLAELHSGVLVAKDPDERAIRAQRLGVIESTFEPLPTDAAVAREWGRLAAAVVARGGQPRRRAMDLVVAATANTNGVALLTDNIADFQIIDDLVQLVPHASDERRGRRSPSCVYNAGTRSAAANSGSRSW